MMRLPKMSILSVFFLVLLILTLCLASCATKGKPPANVAKVGCSADIEWQIAPEAKITQFDCALGKHKKEPSLIFTVGVQNVSDKPQRFRLNIFLLDQDKAAGHLVPRKGKPPVLAAGKANTVKVPFIKTTDLSKEILVVVKKVGY